MTSSQWRYCVDGDDMIWYPPGSVRLFRQKRSEQGLNMAIHRIAKEWAERIRAKEAA